MATLVDADYEKIKQIIHSDPDVTNTFATWSLSKSNWKAVFQAAETWFVNGFSTTPTTSFKAALDAIVTTTNTQAKWVGKVWFMWRIGITW